MIYITTMFHVETKKNCLRLFSLEHSFYQQTLWVVAKRMNIFLFIQFQYSKREFEVRYYFSLNSFGIFLVILYFKIIIDNCCTDKQKADVEIMETQRLFVKNVLRCITMFFGTLANE